MNILIFGASGATGHNLVSQALSQKHSVSAFVRDPSKLRLHKDHIKIIEGDVSDFQKVDEAVRDQDAVLSALGASTPFKSDAALIAGIRNIAAAMEERNVKQLIYQSFLGVDERRDEMGYVVNKLLPVVLKNVIHDHQAKENIIVSSSLNWTIVRCAMLTNGSFTGNYRHGEHITSRSLLPWISRGDVADFMLKQLTDSSYLHKKPRIMY
jgi:putative NADH-flavin reductase